MVRFVTWITKDYEKDENKTESDVLNYERFFNCSSSFDTKYFIMAYGRNYPSLIAQYAHNYCRTDFSFDIDSMYQYGYKIKVFPINFLGIPIWFRFKIKRKNGR